MKDFRMANLYCKDDISQIENYDKAVADPIQTWDCHHRLELTLDGEFAHSREELKRLDMYYNRPYFELIFLTHSEHSKLHNKDKHNSEEVKRKLSKIMLNKSKSSFGKKYYEHFGYSKKENPKQYAREGKYWKTNGKCRWDV